MDNCKELKRIIKEECSIQGVINSKQIDYIIATALWETNHTCRPVTEAYWLSPEWHMTHLFPKYGLYWGRGYVQLTWESNYRKFGKLLGIDLIKYPELEEPERVVGIISHFLFVAERYSITIEST